MSNNNATLNTAPLSSRELMDLLETCFLTPMEGSPADPECKWGLPVLIEGLPGTAKTARIKKLGKQMNAKVAALYAAPHPPEDFSGALVPDFNGSPQDAQQVCLLPQVRDLIKVGRGILFLDEINGGAPATQAALMSLVHERQAGDIVIPGAVRMVGAMNPEEIATGGYALSAPLANRFVHVYDPGPTSEEWVAWLLKNEQDVLRESLEEGEKLIAEDWPKEYPIVQGLIASFMDSHSSLLHSMPKSFSQSSKAWPSARTWEFAINGWTSARILRRSERVVEKILEGCVGPGAASVLLEHATRLRVPSPQDVLQGNWEPNPKRLDITIAACTSMIAYVRQRPARTEQLKLAPAAWREIARVYEAELYDMAVTAAQGLTRANLSVNDSPEIKQAAKPLILDMRKNGFLDGDFLEKD